MQMLAASTGSFIASRYMDFPDDKALAAHMNVLGYDITPFQIRDYRLHKRPNMREPVLFRPEEASRIRSWRS